MLNFLLRRLVRYDFRRMTLCSIGLVSTVPLQPTVSQLLVLAVPTGWSVSQGGCSNCLQVQQLTGTARVLAPGVYLFSKRAEHILIQKDAANRLAKPCHTTW